MLRPADWCDTVSLYVCLLARMFLSSLFRFCSIDIRFNGYWRIFRHLQLLLLLLPSLLTSNQLPAFTEFKNLFAFFLSQIIIFSFFLIIMLLNQISPDSVTRLFFLSLTSSNVSLQLKILVYFLVINLLSFFSSSQLFLFSVKLLKNSFFSSI